jgi:hypothetical protein
MESKEEIYEHVRQFQRFAAITARIEECHSVEEGVEVPRREGP